MGHHGYTRDGLGVQIWRFEDLWPSLMLEKCTREEVDEFCASASLPTEASSEHHVSRAGLFFSFSENATCHAQGCFSRRRCSRA